MSDSIDQHFRSDDRDIINVEEIPTDIPKTKKKIGRPRKPAKSPTNSFTLTISEDLIKQLKIAAIMEDCNVSEVVEKYLSQPKRLPNFKITKSA